MNKFYFRAKKTSINIGYIAVEDGQLQDEKGNFINYKKGDIIACRESNKADKWVVDSKYKNDYIYTDITASIEFLNVQIDGITEQINKINNGMNEYNTNLDGLEKRRNGFIQIKGILGEFI